MMCITGVFWTIFFNNSCKIFLETNFIPESKQLIEAKIKKKTIESPAVSSVAKCTLSVRQVWGLIFGLVKLTQCCQQLATVATFLGSCVAQALSRGDWPWNSLHASA